MSVFDRRRLHVEPILECPRDARAMLKEQVAGVTIDRCDGCSGTWFDAKELRRVANDKEIEALATRLPHVRVVSAFRCPRCGGECVDAFIDEVQVETCTLCAGVWLDRGELATAKRLMHKERMLRAAGPHFREFLARL